MVGICDRPSVLLPMVFGFPMVDKMAPIFWFSNSLDNWKTKLLASQTVVGETGVQIPARVDFFLLSFGMVN